MALNNGSSTLNMLVSYYKKYIYKLLSTKRERFAITVYVFLILKKNLYIYRQQNKAKEK